MATRSNQSNKNVTEVRGLLWCSASAALGTLSTGKVDNKDRVSMGPLTTLTAVSPASNGSPILLLSDLSEHSRNIAENNQVSLLYDGTSSFSNPQAGPRVSVQGYLAPTDDELIAERYLRRHPEARLYAGFGDFRFFTMTVESFYFVGGFARAVWLKPDKVLAASSAAKTIATAEMDILNHMNADHTDALRLFGNNLLGRRGRHWRMIGIDPLGCDLKCGQGIHRLAFETPAATVAACRQALVELAKRARKKDSNFPKIRS